MSRDELAVLDGGKCILQLRGVRPFLSDKYDLTQHPNYKMTSDADPKNALDIEKYLSHKEKSARTTSSSSWMLIHSRPPDKDERLFILTQKAHQKISPCRSLRQFTSRFRVCAGSLFAKQRRRNMEFFNSAVDVLKTLVVALGCRSGRVGVLSNLMEGYGNDNPGANAHVR